MDESIREIAHIASGYAGSSLQLPIDDVSSFHCLSAIHQAEPLYVQTFLAAPLLILCEFMHYMEFSSINFTGWQVNGKECDSGLHSSPHIELEVTT